MLKKVPVLLPSRPDTESLALEQNHYYYRHAANGKASLANDLRATLSLLGSNSKPANGKDPSPGMTQINFVRVTKKQEPQKKCLLSVIKGQHAASESPERVFSSINLKHFDIDIRPEKETRRTNPYSSSSTLISGY